MRVQTIKDAHTRAGVQKNRQTLGVVIIRFIRDGIEWKGQGTLEIIAPGSVLEGEIINKGT